MIPNEVPGTPIPSVRCSLPDPVPQVPTPLAATVPFTTIVTASLVATARPKLGTLKLLYAGSGFVGVAVRSLSSTTKLIFVIKSSSSNFKFCRSSELNSLLS